MKIGIDGSSLITQKTGLGVYTTGLLEALGRIANGAKLVVYRPDRGSDLNTPQRLWWEGVELARKARLDHVDVLYSPAFSPPLLGGFRRVVTVHDLIGLVYPKNVKGAARFYWSIWLPAAIRRADRIVAISESTRQDIERFLKIPAKRVELVPSAVRQHFKVLEDAQRVGSVLKKYGLCRPYIVSVSTLEPRKNLLNLVRAYEKVRVRTEEPMLVLAGKPGGAEHEIISYLKEKGLQEDVRLLGYVSDEDVVCLYNGALAFAMVSMYEGFGLPALEAMACGLTGVASKTSSLPEVVGDGALLVDPHSVNEIAEALFALCNNGPQKQELIRAAIAQSAHFSIEKIADTMMRIFKEEAAR